MSTRDFDTISYIGPEELDGNSGELMIDKANVLSDALSDLVKENVKIIVFEKHVKSIGSEAFEGCPNLEAVYFNHGVDEIGYGAFMGCPNLATLDLVGEPDLQYLRENRKLLNSNLSGRRYSVIGDYAFAGCESLSEIDLDSVLIIGEHAFEGCTSLQSIENLNNPRLIGSQAFAGTPVKSLEITSDKCLISKGAFADCKDLTSLDMLVGQLTILENAFHNCKNLHNFTGRSTTLISTHTHSREQTTLGYIHSSVTRIICHAMKILTVLATHSSNLLNHTLAKNNNAIGNKLER